MKGDHRNHQWKRVTGPDLDGVGKTLRTKRNKVVMASAVFRNACAKAGVQPTVRQARKFRRKQGAAYANR